MAEQIVRAPSHGDCAAGGVSELRPGYLTEMSDPSKLDTSHTSQASRAADAPSHQQPDEGPSDGTTLTAVVDAYRQSGFATDFHAEEADPEVHRDGDPRAIIRCANCASALDPRQAAIHSMRRLEGASDPADMAAIVATTCPVCGADGTLVLAYGPMADGADSDVLAAMQDRRGDDILPADQPPAESSGAEVPPPS